MIDVTIPMLIALILLLLILLIGLARTIIGPSLQDRMLSVQLLGLTHNNLGCVFKS